MLSPKSARMADELGYTSVKVYHAGIPPWKKAGSPPYSTVRSLVEFNEKVIPHLLVDVRAEYESSQGVIPGAVAVPLSALSGWKTIFP